MKIRYSKIAVSAACLAPLSWLAWRAFQGELTANPIEFVTHFTGTWAIQLLLVTLAITPARRLFGAPSLIRFRRMLGLYAFFYAALHFLTYLCLDKFFDFAGIAKDVTKRPFIIAGATAFLILVALAATSTKGWIRRLGGARWQGLHRLVYVAAVAGVLHYWWLVKSDIRRPAVYGALVALLLLARLIVWVRKHPPGYGRATSTAAERGLS